MTTFQNPSQDVIADYLKNAKTIAVVGLSHRENSPAYRCFKNHARSWLYDLFLSIQDLAGQKILKRRQAYARLQDVTCPQLDIV